jgi:hypothetical protein
MILNWQLMTFYIADCVHNDRSAATIAQRRNLQEHRVASHLNSGQLGEPKMFVLRSDTPDSVMATNPSGQRRPKCHPIRPEMERSSQSDREHPAEFLGNGGSMPETLVDVNRSVAGASMMRSSSSRNVPVLPIFASAFAVRFGGAAAALECPKHIADTKALIDRISANMESAAKRLPPEVAALAIDLIDDARMLLAAARQNHETPKGPYDHARAFAKADAALGHARAAEVLQTRGQLERP